MMEQSGPWKEKLWQTMYGREFCRTAPVCDCGRPLLFYLDPLDGEIKRAVRCVGCICNDIEDIMSGFRNLETVIDRDGIPKPYTEILWQPEVKTEMNERGKKT